MFTSFNNHHISAVTIIVVGPSALISSASFLVVDFPSRISNWQFGDNLCHAVYFWTSPTYIGKGENLDFTFRKYVLGESFTANRTPTKQVENIEQSLEYSLKVSEYCK